MKDMASVIHDQLAPCVKTLEKCGFIGVMKENPRILEIKSSTPTLTDYSCGDRFKIAVPYAKQLIAWEILFNCCCPNKPPDIIFGPDDRNFHLDLHECQSLLSYDSSDRFALRKFVVDVLKQYKEYHLSLARQSAHIRTEYTTLLDSGFKQEDIEIHVQQKKERFGNVNILVKLEIDLENIPPYLIRENPGENTAVLLITYQTPDSYKPSSQLFLSPRLQNILGSANSMKIPIIQSRTHLIEYISQLITLLKNKVNQVISYHEKRVEYVSAFLAHYERSVIEYDAEKYTSISFLFEWNDFFFIIHIEIALNFPLVKPTLTFQSVYHESNQQKPFSVTIEHYPYSPRWSGIEMAERLRSYILEYIAEFQKTSITGGLI
ncbi:BRISC and BRCA1-A complex member 2-like [Tubulanus polymorphus]|uniref:BRISC and BRCA1-A complex member 2-like n=1 Tax=Tubulanus polymorphus TaxID=672921 RepID=UPI003DA2D51B